VIVNKFISNTKRRKGSTMSVKYEKYLQVLANSFKQIFEKMSKKQIDSYSVKSIKESDASDYAVGVVVPYEDEKNRLAGKFLLGLSDKKKALHLASTIAKESGLPAISEFDDMAADILYEFMNTVVGQTITEWDNLGLSVAFGTPLSLDGEKIEKTLNTTHENYIVTLSVSGESIAIFITFEEAVESVLMGKKVLVVDDSRMIRMILRQEFEKQSCLVIEAADGQEGVEKFSNELPDLTIMDLVMPKMDGLEAIGQIRKMTSEAKVIVLTSTSKKSDVLAAASLGIRGYVKKPIKSEKLIELATDCFK
jgi:two-component system chemotaxis response regulator CheY